MVQDHGEREEEALPTYPGHTGGGKDAPEIVAGQFSLKGHYCNEEKWNLDSLIFGRSYFSGHCVSFF